MSGLRGMMGLHGEAVNRDMATATEASRRPPNFVAKWHTLLCEKCDHFRGAEDVTPCSLITEGGECCKGRRTAKEEYELQVQRGSPPTGNERCLWYVGVPTYQQFIDKLCELAAAAAGNNGDQSDA
jgi:hypothetical protein